MQPNNYELIMDPFTATIVAIAPIHIAVARRFAGPTAAWVARVSIGSLDLSVLTDVIASQFANRLLDNLVRNLHVRAHSMRRARGAVSSEATITATRNAAFISWEELMAEIHLLIERKECT